MRKIFLAVVVVVGSVSLQLSAAEYRLLELNGRYVKWGQATFGKPATVTYGIAEKFRHFPDAINCSDIGPLRMLIEGQGIRATEFRRETDAAFKMWSSAANVTFQYVNEPDRADILIGVQSTPRGIAFANVWPEVGDNERLSEIKKSVVCLNPSVRWEASFDGNDDTYSIRRVIAHEIGHAIGLDHPGRFGQLMGFDYSEKTDGLRNGDVLGATKLYGRPDNGSKK